MIATPIAAPALRLTRRGRIVLVGLAVLAAILVALAVAGSAAATGTGVPARVYEKHLSQVVVQPGDSLWSIAARAEPNADPRLVVQRITEINALPSPEIAAGQRLWVPKE
jgi:LysM repeat protein